MSFPETILKSKGMTFDFSLWPMLTPIILPIAFCARFKRESLPGVLTVAAVMAAIVVLYLPMVGSDILDFRTTYFLSKTLLFVVMPIATLYIIGAARKTPF